MTLPENEEFYGHGGFPAERTKKCQAPTKLTQPFLAPEVRAGKTTYMRLFSKFAFSLRNGKQEKVRLIFICSRFRMGGAVGGQFKDLDLSLQEGGSFFYLQLELLCLQLSFLAYSLFRCADALKRLQL